MMWRTGCSRKSRLMPGSLPKPPPRTLYGESWISCAFHLTVRSRPAASVCRYPLGTRGPAVVTPPCRDARASTGARRRIARCRSRGPPPYRSQRPAPGEDMAKRMRVQLTAAGLIPSLLTDHREGFRPRSRRSLEPPCLLGQQDAVDERCGSREAAGERRRVA